MNDKFYALPKERQQKIIGAGFRVFALNSYRKSPMQEIADLAGISKSLLFHYFRNKKELYFFLWEKACDITIRYLTAYGCYEPSDLFEMMDRGMQAKIKMMRRFPHLTKFAIKAFFEGDPEISAAIQKSFKRHFSIKAQATLLRVDPNDFIPGLDLEMMYREMYLAAEGYLWEIIQSGGILEADRMEKDFKDMLAFWKKIYLRKE